MPTAIDQEMMHCFAPLQPAQQKSLLQLVKTILHTDAISEAAEERQTLEEYNQDIDEAIAEAASGEYITLEALMQKRTARQ